MLDPIQALLDDPSSLPQVVDALLLGESKWMQSARASMKRRGTVGALHQELGIAQGSPIPTHRLQAEKARLHAKAVQGTLSPHETRKSRRVNFALNARGGR